MVGGFCFRRKTRRLHDACPLVGGHGAGAGVGEQIDEYVVGFNRKRL